MAVLMEVNSIISYDPGAGIDASQSALIVDGSLTLSGTYGGGSPAHGDVIDFHDARITSGSIPRKVEIFQYKAAGQQPAAYSFLYAYGTDASDGELTVIDLTTGLEITQGAAYPTELTTGIGSPPADPGIRFRAWFPKFI